MSARRALKIEIGYGQMREIIWIWGQTREILPLGQTCEISEARHRHTTHPWDFIKRRELLQPYIASTLHGMVLYGWNGKAVHRTFGFALRAVRLSRPRRLSRRNAWINCLLLRL